MKGGVDGPIFLTFDDGAAAAVLARSDAGNVAAARVGAGHTVAGDVIQALPEALAPRRD